MEDLFSPRPPRYYPEIKISLIKNPNRLYAFPLLGFLIKIFLLIPVFIWLAILGLAVGIVTIINSFIVLIQGKYWHTAYQLTVGLIRLSIKIFFYLDGLTDKYPGFSLQINDQYSIDIPEPKNPNKLYAIPLMGGLIRIILLIPYLLWSQILSRSSFFAIIPASFVVLFKGRYPESSFEIVRDSMRLNQSLSVYTFGLSDTYPSFYISFNHQLAKIIYITLGILSTFNNYSGNFQQVNKYFFYNY